MQLKLSAAISAALLLFSFNIHSDDHIQPTFIPVESFACNYSDGKDMDDLLKVTEEWNEYADETGFQYSAWIFQ